MASAQAVPSWQTSPEIRQHKTPLGANDPSSQAPLVQVDTAQVKAVNVLRQKSLVSDADKLLRLVASLNDELAHEHSDTATPKELRKMSEIEKLARNVKEKMANTNGPSQLPPPPFFQLPGR